LSLPANPEPQLLEPQRLAAPRLRGAAARAPRRANGGGAREAPAAGSLEAEVRHAAAPPQSQPLFHGDVEAERTGRGFDGFVDSGL
jgi:hypothetical protein